MSNPFLFLYRFFKTRKGIFFPLLLLLLGVASFFAWQLDLEEDITRMMPMDEEVAELQHVLQHSEVTDKIIIHVKAEDTTKKVPADSLIAFGDAMVQELEEQWMPENIAEIRYKVSDNTMMDVFGTFYEHLPIFLEKEDYATIDSLIRPQKVKESLQGHYHTLVSPASVAMKEFILKDPVGIAPIALQKLEKLRFGKELDLHDGRIMDQKQQHLFFFLTPAYPPNETSHNAELVHGLRQLTDSLNAASPRVNAEYFGTTPIAVANAEQIKKDIRLTVTVALITLMVLISIFFRKKRVFFLIFLPVIFGGAFSLAVLFLFKGQVSAVALGMGSVLLGITIDFSLHIFTHFRHSGSSEKTIKDLTAPVLMSCMTTAFAFLCLLFVRSQALHDLGLFASISVVIAALFALLILPHFFGKGMMKKETEKSSDGWIDRLAQYPLHRNKWLVIGVIAFSIVCAVTYRYVGFEDDMSKMNYMPKRMQAAEQRLNEVNSYALKTIYLVSSGQSLHEALEHDGRVSGLVDSLKEIGVVENAVQVGELLVPEKVQKERIRRWEHYWTDEKKEQLEQVIREKSASLGFKGSAFNDFYETLNKNHKPYPSSEFQNLREAFLNEYINESDSMTTVASLLKVKDEKSAEVVYNTFSGKEGVSVLDKAYLMRKFVNILKEDFDTLVSVSLFIVFLILLIVYGRIEPTLFTFIPMALGWLWTLGVMGVAGVEFNIFNVVIGTFVFGLGVDYTIFISRGMLQDFKYGEKDLVSYKTSILLSAFTTIVGIGVLVFAKHPALKSIAVLSIIGILSVIVVAFTLQPLLYEWFMMKRKKKGNVPMTFMNFVISLLIFLIFLVGCLFMTLMGVIFLLPPLKKNRKRKAFYHRMLMYICRFVIYSPFHVRKRIINEPGEDFSKPAVIISNHQSHIDLPFILMMHPKIIVLTADWVWNNPFYGAIVKLCDFYPVSWGNDQLGPLLQEKVKEGYSILVFPEGSRSPDQKIKRFHKGGFYLAEQLGLDILPVLLHGLGDAMTKGDNHLKQGQITLKVMDRVAPDEFRFGSTYKERAKGMAKFYREEFQKMRFELEKPSYYRDKLVKNYIFKGPVLEWYLKVKLSLESNYELFHKFIPHDAAIVDIGCGYGYLDYMLHFLSEERKITGFDYDDDKIRIAAGCPSKNDSLRFFAADATELALPESDVFILSDVLHYMPENEQQKLVEQCIDRLRPEGSILIRDADKDLKKRHSGTKLTEMFSTRSGFNKTKFDLEFVSRKSIIDLAQRKGMTAEVVDNARFTSNILIVLKKN